MNNHNMPPMPASHDIVEINGECRVRDIKMNISVPFDPMNPVHQELLRPKTDLNPTIAPEATNDRRKNKRPYTTGSRIAIGGFVVGTLVMAPISYKTAEKVVFEVMDMASLEDKTLEQGEPWDTIFNNNNAENK